MGPEDSKRLEKRNYLRDAFGELNERWNDRLVLERQFTLGTCPESNPYDSPQFAARPDSAGDLTLCKPPISSLL